MRACRAGYDHATSNRSGDDAGNDTRHHRHVRNRNVTGNRNDGDLTGNRDDSHLAWNGNDVHITGNGNGHIAGNRRDVNGYVHIAWSMRGITRG